MLCGEGCSGEEGSDDTELIMITIRFLEKKPMQSAIITSVLSETNMGGMCGHITLQSKILLKFGCSFLIVLNFAFLQID